VRLRVEGRHLHASVHRRGLGGAAALVQAEREWPGAEPGGPGALRPALDDLLRGLESGVAMRGAVADVEIADAWFAFDVIEGEFADHGERDLQAVALACLGELLGPAAAEHELRWQLQADERHLLICALPRAVADTLRECLQSHGVRTRRLQPLFCGQWNRAAAKLVRPNSVLIAMQGAGGSIACSQRGAITALSRAWTHDPVHIDAQVDHLLASLGLDAATTERVWTGDAPAAPASPLPRDLASADAGSAA
jgi:hypothetical protein